MERFTALLTGLGVSLLLLALWLLLRVTARGTNGWDADPLAEAEVYLAYGQRKKAIEVLQRATETHPDRADIAMKLHELRINQ
jgi:hypothetical protein